MPVRVRKDGRRYRVVEASTGRIARNASGSSADGGGHATRASAERQARAINAKERKRR